MGTSKERPGVQAVAKGDKAMGLTLRVLYGLQSGTVLHARLEDDDSFGASTVTARPRRRCLVTCHTVSSTG